MRSLQATRGRDSPLKPRSQRDRTALTRASRKERGERTKAQSAHRLHQENLTHSTRRSPAGRSWRGAHTAERGAQYAGKTSTDTHGWGAGLWTQHATHGVKSLSQPPRGESWSWSGHATTKQHTRAGTCKSTQGGPSQRPTYWTRVKSHASSRGPQASRATPLTHCYGRLSA